MKKVICFTIYFDVHQGQYQYSHLNEVKSIDDECTSLISAVRTLRAVPFLQ